LLSFNQLINDNNSNNERSLSSHHQHDPSQWSSSKPSTLLTNDLDSSQSTSLPSITKQRSL
ncbi:unnamed protein product, partial [Rotaria sordida]